MKKTANEITLRRNLSTKAQSAISSIDPLNIYEKIVQHENGEEETLYNCEFFGDDWRTLDDLNAFFEEWADELDEVEE